MLAKLLQLGNKTKQILRIASCIGCSFSFSLLSYLCERVSFKEADSNDRFVLGSIQPSDLSEAISVNYIQQGNSPGIYSFPHDRIQQACYSLNGKGQALSRIHIQIGRAMLSKMENGFSSDPSMLFQVVSNLNRGRDQISEDREWSSLSMLNYAASNQNKKAGDFLNALEFLNIGLECLKKANKVESLDACWERNYTEACKLYLQAQEIYYLLGKIPEGDTFFDSIKEKAANNLDLARAYSNKLIDFEKRNDFQQRMKIGIEFLIRTSSPAANMLSVDPDTATRTFFATKGRIEANDYEQLKAMKKSSTEDGESMVISFLMRIMPIIKKQESFIYSCSRIIEIALDHCCFYEETYLALEMFSLLCFSPFEYFKVCKDINRILVERTEAKNHLDFMFYYSSATIALFISQNKLVSESQRFSKYAIAAGNPRMASYGVLNEAIYTHISGLDIRQILKVFL